MEQAIAPKKQRRLTKKQRGFVNDYADTGNGTQSVLKNYDTKDEKIAGVIAVQNLGKLNVQEELRKLGFDSNNAKRVISEILNNEEMEPKDRIKAAENVFKVHGDYAAEKHVTLSVIVEPSPRIKALADQLLVLQSSDEERNENDTGTVQED